MIDKEVISAKRDFRLLILSMVLQTDWMLRYGSILSPDYFVADDEKDIVAFVSSYYDAYNDVPSRVVLEDKFPDANILDELLCNLSISELEYAADAAVSFARVQSMKLAIIQSVDDIKAGDLNKPFERVQSALSVGDDITDLGLDLIDNVEDWVFDEIHGERIPTGWVGVDRLLEGGLVPGEYGLIMTPSGRGKTTALINIGAAAAGLLSGHNVLHLTYEMPATKILKRYAARISGIMLSRSDRGSDYITKFERKIDGRMRGRLRVINPADKTVSGARSIVRRLSAEGFDVELLIVDYPDLLNPPNRRTERRFELADISRDLRALGDEFGMPVWGATQAGRHTFYKEVITEQDVAEAIEKVNIADVLIALCQTREEEKLGKGRLFLVKVRDAKSKGMIPVKIDFARQAILQRGDMLFDGS